MLVTPLELPGAYLIEIEPLEDERGFFGRSFCAAEFEARGLNPAVVQCNVSFNREAGTVRGMHYQAAPYEEAKLVRCTRGGVHDILIDLRPGSPTLGRWVAAELTAENHRMLYVPEGFAHGFQTLADGTEVFYQMAQSYQPGGARGVRWNDPAFGIRWPLPVRMSSPKDLLFPAWEPAR